MISKRRELVASHLYDARIEAVKDALRRRYDPLTAHPERDLLRLEAEKDAYLTTQRPWQRRIRAA